MIRFSSKRWACAREAGAVEFAGAALSKFPNSAPVQSAALLVVNRTCVKNTEAGMFFIMRICFVCLWQPGWLGHYNPG